MKFSKEIFKGDVRSYMKKRKDNGLRAILCLAVATVVVGGTSIAISRQENAGSVPLDVTGASNQIKEARQNADGTYTVVVSENGYAGEMLFEIIYSGDGQTLVSYDVIRHTETEGYGSRVNEEENKEKLVGVRLPVTTDGLDISDILGENQESSEDENTVLTDGTYTGQTTADENGDYNFASVTVEHGRVTRVVWDEITGGASKAELSAAGQYVMVEGNPTWKEQSEALGVYVVEHQTTAGLMNESGHTDAVSGVSISVGGFVDLVNQAMAQAKGISTEPPKIDATTVDVVTGATFSSKAVLRAIDEGFVYLREFVLEK